MLANMIAPDSMLERSQTQIPIIILERMLLDMCGNISCWEFVETYVNTHDIPQAQDLLTKDLPSGPKREAFCCMLLYHSTAQTAIICNLVT